MKRLLIALSFILATFSVVARDFTSDANILAGRGSPSVNPSVQSIWKQHRDQLAPQWKKLGEQRLAKMKEWSGVELKADNCKTMLYPFSGPDFFNAYVLFPNCDTYIFFGLENASQLPEMNKLNKVQFATLMSDFRESMTDILQRNYFITKQMFHQLHTFQLEGATPIIAAEMTAFDIEIKSIEHKPGSRVVKIVFVSSLTKKQQTLYYYSVDVSNEGLHKHNADFLDIIRHNKPTYTLLKSASYLLHIREFTNVRDTILDVTTVLVQDDTGIPYQFLARGWKVKLYGQYDKPIADFTYGYQPDLEHAYKVSPNVQLLPFPFGYRWQIGKSGLIVARKIK